MDKDGVYYHTMDYIPDEKLQALKLEGHVMGETPAETVRRYFQDCVLEAAAVLREIAVGNLKTNNIQYNAAKLILECAIGKTSATAELPKTEIEHYYIEAKETIENKNGG